MSAFVKLVLIFAVPTGVTVLCILVEFYPIIELVGLDPFVSFISETFPKRDFWEALTAEAVGITVEIVIVLVLFRLWENKRKKNQDKKKWSKARVRLAVRFMSIHKSNISKINCPNKTKDIDNLMGDFDRCLNSSIENAFHDYIKSDERLISFLSQQKDRIDKKSSTKCYKENRFYNESQFSYDLFELCRRREKTAFVIMKECGKNIDAFSEMHLIIQRSSQLASIFKNKINKK